MAEYNLLKAALAQKKLCNQTGILFAPQDGCCFFCGKNIYVESNTSEGYSVEYASKHVITGCPHCHKSFCD